MLSSVIKRCPSCGNLVPIADMVGADGETQRCSACNAQAMVNRGNRLHDLHLQSIAGMPHDELVALGEQRTRMIRRKIIEVKKAREASERQRHRKKAAALRGDAR